jgi:Ca2+-binding RTX toxin-like protein
LVVNNSQTFQIQGIESGGEPARIDYIEFIPVTPVTINGTNAAETLTGDAKNNTINGLGGNDILSGGAGHDRLNGGNGLDTADYSQATNGIIANLKTGIVLAPIYGTSNQQKIMPLGDSITGGEHAVAPTPGAYRIQLWKDFAADGLKVDFVGSQFNGPTSLGDKNHEGHGGWTIDQITGLVSGGLINTYQPDTVLLMIGTNDTRTSSLSEMYADLSNLIEQITARSPNTNLLVSSIAPTDPAIVGQTRANKTKDFNLLIPDLISDKVTQGRKVAFVNAGGSLTLNDLVSDGRHPNAQGYNKLGNAWYDAIVKRDTLTSIEDLTGTAFDDTLIGNTSGNALKGGTGRDILVGGGGADNFVYRAPTEGEDIITDFSVNDIFRISASGFGSGLVAGTALNTRASETGVFVSSADPTPRGSSANFLYNTNTGLLNFDQDGTGPNTALALATLTNTPLLSVNQFRIS